MLHSISYRTLAFPYNFVDVNRMSRDANEFVRLDNDVRRNTNVLNLVINLESRRESQCIFKPTFLVNRHYRKRCFSWILQECVIRHRFYDEGFRLNFLLRTSVEFSLPSFLVSRRLHINGPGSDSRRDAKHGWAVFLFSWQTIFSTTCSRPFPPEQFLNWLHQYLSGIEVKTFPLVFHW